jgi:WD repeat-containing protein 59
MNGPWAEGGRPAFLRVQFTFPELYPHSLAEEDSPLVNLETSVAISRSTKTKMLAKLEELRREERPCLSACIAYLLGYEERGGRLGLRQEESDSDEDELERLPFQQPMMPKKACGASFGPNG